MIPIHHIAVVKPLASPSYESIAYALELAHSLKAHLTVVLSYSSGGEEGQPVPFCIRRDVEAAFTHIKNNILSKAQLPYRLVSSDRALCQDMEFSLDAYHPDIMIAIREDVQALPLLIRQSRLPLLLLPSGISYRPINKIALAYDASLTDNTEVFSDVAALTSHLQASLQVVEVAGRHSLVPLQESRSNMELDYLLKDTRHTFHFLEGKDVESAIARYVQQQGIDWLLMLARPCLPAVTNSAERHTVAMLKKVKLPVLILKI